MVNPKSLEEQPQVPFDFAQGRLSTPFAAENAANYAQDDSAIVMRTSDSGH